MKRIVVVALVGLLVVGAVAALALTRDRGLAAGETVTVLVARPEHWMAAPPPTTTIEGTAGTEGTEGTEGTVDTEDTEATEVAERRRRRNARQISSTCPSSRHGVVVDRARQRAWLCRRGRALPEFPVTTAVSQPEPDTYEIYAKEQQTTSDFGDEASRLDLFVAFSYGKFTDARIGFHAIPRYFDGTLAQTPESVGSTEMFGVSSGCIRLLPADAERLWDFLAVGDEVRVIS